MSKKGKVFYGWYLVVFVWIIYFINVAIPLYGGSVVNSLMTVSLGISAATMGLAVSLNTAVQGFAAPIAGIVIKNLGYKRSFIIGSILTIIGSLCMAILKPTGIGYIFLYGVMIGSGISIGCLIGGQALVNEWFDAQKPTALSIVLTAGTIGGFLASPLLSAVANMAGWEWAWIICAAFCVVAILLSAFCIKDRPEEIGEVKDGRDYAGGGTKAKKRTLKLPQFTHDLTMKEALSTREFWMFSFLSIVRVALYFGMIGHIVRFAMSTGMESGKAAFLISIISIAGLFGRLLGGVIGRMIPSKYEVGLGFCLMGCAGVLFFLGSSGALFVAAAAFLGFGMGINYVGQSLLLAEYFGNANFSVIMGIIIMISNGVGSLGSTVLGYMAETTGSYNGTFGIFGVGCILAGLLVLTFKHSKLRFLTE